MAENKAKKPVLECLDEWKEYHAAAANHQLLVQKCTSCSRYHYPAADLCPACSSQLKWVPASGKATLYTFIIMHQLYHPGFKDELPYNVSVVQLEEGPMMLTNIVGVGNSDLKIGMPVKVCFEDRAPGETIPMFQPA